jgi:hypothetical protein
MMNKTLAVVVLIMVIVVAALLLNSLPKLSEEQRTAVLQKTPREAYMEALRSGSPDQIEDTWRQWKGRRVLLEDNQSLTISAEEWVKVEEIPSFPIDPTKVEVSDNRLINHTGQDIIVWLYPKPVSGL